MKKLSLILLLTSFAHFLPAQEKPHQLVFDFTKGDTASFSAMIRQTYNILRMAGNAKLEIVCHGPGLDFVLKDKTNVQKEIEELNSKYHVVFAACEATMKRLAIDPGRLVSQVRIVPLATIEIATKQQLGWNYIKAGY